VLFYYPSIRERRSQTCIKLIAWYNFIPTWRIFTLPLFIGVAFAASMGAGLWLASLNVQYRDFRFIVPFIVQFGLYISPVGFSSTIVPEKWRFLYSLNPMVGVIDVDTIKLLLYPYKSRVFVIL
jgi:lipopolysaccharide transport system permease protein